MAVRVRPVTSDDFESIAAIHRSSYSKEHLTSFFPLELLRIYYKAVWDENHFAFIATNVTNQPIGFIIGGYKLDEPIQKFIKTHKLALAKVVLRHPKFILLKIADKLKRSSEEKHSSTPFQLLSVAVINGQQSSGTGKLLFLAVEEQLRKDNIMQYGLSVKKTNTRAIRFYERLDFEMEFETVTMKHYYKILK